MTTLTRGQCAPLLLRSSPVLRSTIPHSARQRHVFLRYDLRRGRADYFAYPLVAEQWRTRPLVVVAPSAQHPLLTGLQAQLRQARWRDAFQEREMVLFTVIGGEGRRDGQPLSADQTAGLLQALNLTTSSPAAALLIGKDGGIKLTEQGVSVHLQCVTFELSIGTK